MATAGAPNSPAGQSLTTEEKDQFDRSTKRVKKVRIIRERAGDSAEGSDGRVMNDGDLPGEGGKRKFLYRDSVLAIASQEILVDEPTANIQEGMELDDSNELEGFDSDDIRFTKGQFRRFRNPWRLGLIVKILGRKVGYRYLYRRLIQLWRPKSGFKLTSLGYDFYVARFSSVDDRESVLRDGPWKILDHYLAIRPWIPNFRPSKATIDRAALWVRIPDLPMEVYNDEGLRGVGELLGKTIKIDMNSKEGEIANFARICVEVDLISSLQADFTLLGERYYVQYEGIHLLCFGCGRYGHKAENCSQKEGPEGEKAGSQCEAEVSEGQPRENPSTQSPPAGYGSWTLVGLPNRKGGGKIGNSVGKFGEVGGNRGVKSGVDGRIHGVKSGNGSRFHILENLDNHDTWEKPRQVSWTKEANPNDKGKAILSFTGPKTPAGPILFKAQALIKPAPSMKNKASRDGPRRVAAAPGLAQGQRSKPTTPLLGLPHEGHERFKSDPQSIVSRAANPPAPMDLVVHAWRA